MMTLARKTWLAHRLLQISYAALLLWLSLWYLLILPARTDNPWVIWLIHVLPLSAFVKVVWQGKPRGCAWLCFVLLLYFTGAVLAAASPLTRWLGVVECVLIVLLFSSAMLFARWKSQSNRGLK